MDGLRGTLLPLATGFYLRPIKPGAVAVSWRGVAGERVAEEVGWTSLEAEVARLDCLMAKNQLEVHLQRLIELSTISHGYTTSSQ